MLARCRVCIERFSHFSLESGTVHKGWNILVKVGSV